MPPRRGRGPSTFTEWMVGTTIPPPRAASRPKPSKRDVFRLEMTTDDEAEEDTLKISYPRTARARRKKREEASPPKEVEPAYKEVRFEESTESEPVVVPLKSALKKRTKTITTVETEEEVSEVDEPAEITTEAEDDDKSVKCKKKAKSDSDSDCATNPHPTCTCLRCSIAREFIVREFLKTSKKNRSDTDTAASDSEAKGNKNQQKNKGKKKQDTPDASESESEAPAKKKGQAPNKSNLKAKKNAPDSDAEASQSESEIPPNAPKKKVVSFQKVDSDSESAKESDAGSGKRKKKNANAQAEGTKNKTKPQKGGKKSKKVVEVSSSEYTTDESSEDEVVITKKSKKSKKIRKKQESESESEADSMAANFHRPNGKQGYLKPALRRPYFVDPIRAAVVQEERVIESPVDPPPNSYYDPQHNVLRIYNGPMYGHHGHALYPPSGHGQHPPMPMGMPHPSNNPYWYGGYKNDPPQYTGFNNPENVAAAQKNGQTQAQYHQQQQEVHRQYHQQQQQQRDQQNQQQQKPDSNNQPHPPGAYDYAMPGQVHPQVPVTQGVPAPGMPAPGYVPGVPWNTNVFQDPAWLPGHYPAGPKYGPPPNPWEQTRYEKDVAAEPAKPPSSKDQNKDGENNVIPDGMKTSSSSNPYVPKSNKSAFSVWGADVHRAASNASKAPTNGMNNDGAGWDNQAPADGTNNGGGWDNAPAVEGWGNTDTQQPPADVWGTTEGARKSSHGTVKSQKNDGWGPTEEWDKRSHKGSDKGKRVYPNIEDIGKNNNDPWMSGGNGAENNGSKSNKSGDTNSNNVMPGTWINTPNVTVPFWGDATAAADTQGQVNW